MSTYSRTSDSYLGNTNGRTLISHLRYVRNAYVLKKHVSICVDRANSECPPPSLFFWAVIEITYSFGNIFVLELTNTYIFTSLQDCKGVKRHSNWLAFTKLSLILDTNSIALSLQQAYPTFQGNNGWGGNSSNLWYACITFVISLHTSISDFQPPTSNHHNINCGSSRSRPKFPGIHCKWRSHHHSFTAWIIWTNNPR